MTTDPKNNFPDLLEEYHQRVTKAQIGHYSQCEIKHNWHTVISMLIIILATIVSSFLFFNYSANDSGLKTIITICSISAALLAALQPQLRLGEKAENHRAKAVQYGQLRRQIEVFIAADSTIDEQKKFIMQFTQKWDEVAADAPLTPKQVRDLIK